MPPEDRIAEDPFAKDPLAVRLARIRIEPMPRELVPNALGAAPMRSHAPWRACVVAGLALALAAGATGLGQPQIRLALAQAPLIGPSAADLMKQYGWLPRSSTGELKVVSANGATVHLVAAYDDGNRVVVALRIESAGLQLDTRDVTMTDASGRRLTPAALAYGRPQGAEWLFAFLRAPGTKPPSSELTLQVLRLYRLETGSGGMPILGQALDGPWSLRFGVGAAQRATELPVPGPGSVGAVTVRFTTLRVSEHYIDLRLELTGSPDDVSRLRIQLFDARDHVVMPIDVGEDSIYGRAGPPNVVSPEPFHRAELYLRGDVRYRLVVTGPSGERLAWTIELS